jgi:hypothetical protein
MDLIDILVSFILNGVLILIFRSIIQSAHDRDMAQIQADNQVTLAQLNAQLEQATRIQLTRFADLHERRAEIIADLYKLLARAESRLQYAHFPMPWIGDEKVTGWERAMKKIEPTTQAVDTLVEFYRENKIFLTPTQVSMMDNIMTIVQDLRTSVMMRELQRESPPEEKDVREFAERSTKKKLDDALAAYQEIYPTLKQDLENDFRKILGFEIDVEE